MESAEYKKQYDEYLARAEKALNQACARYLPEESDVCRAARYSLLGGGKRIRAVLGLAYARLRFTTETAEECVSVVQNYLDAAPAAGDFTRGLYERGVE